MKASLIWKDNQTQIKVEDWWKEPKNHESDLFSS